MVDLPHQSDLSFANSRGVGQFHIFDRNGLYERMTWNSFNIAKACAEKHGCNVVNMDGEIVYRS